jgi:hypothetical protein
MQVVNFSITLPDETHSSTQVHVFGPGIRELIVEVPAEDGAEARNRFQANATSRETASAAAARRAQDDYVLGGYAGI